MDRRSFVIKGDFPKTLAVYVQIAIDVVHHVYIDEPEIFGYTDVTGALDVVPDTKPIFNAKKAPIEINQYPAEDILRARNMALTYNFRPDAEDKGLQTEENYLPLTAYLDKSGNILDTLFSRFGL